MDYGFDSRGNVLSQFARWQEEVETLAARIRRGLDYVETWEADNGRPATAAEVAGILNHHAGRGHIQGVDWGFILYHVMTDAALKKAQEPAP